MVIQKISAIVVAAVCAGGIGAWAWTQQAQSKHAQPTDTAAAESSQPTVLANAAASELPQLTAASASTVAADPAVLPHCDCDCTQPVRTKYHAKAKKVHRPYQPEPSAPPVAVVQPAPQPVYNQPVVVTSPPPVVVGSVVPYSYYYGYGGYPVGGFGYYNSYGGRYWANGGARYSVRGSGGLHGEVSRGEYGHRR